MRERRSGWRTAIGSIALGALASGVRPAAAVEVESQGEIGLETRAFQPDDDAGTHDAAAAAVGRLKVEAQQGAFRLRLRGFVRHDAIDRGRSAAFPEEAWLEAKGERLRLVVGWDMLTWTATEAFHPTDVVNSRYFDSNVEAFEKIGEPMAALRVKLGNGNVTGYLMPFFTAPIFPSRRSRMSFTPSSMPLGAPLWLSRDGKISGDFADRFGLQWAVRAQQTIGDADVSLHFMQHQDRFNPIVGFDAATGQIRPLFVPVTQGGLTYTQPFGGLLVKLEAAYNFFARPDIGAQATFFDQENRDHGAVAAGLEYAVPWDNGWEATFIAEGQTVFGEGKGLWRGNQRIRRTLNLFQRDVMGGMRLAFQDQNDSAVLLFVVVDLERPEEFFVNAGYTQRLGEVWSLKAGLRIFNLPPLDAAAPVGFERWHKANQLYLTLLRHF